MQPVGRGGGFAVFMSEDRAKGTAVTCSTHPNWSRPTSGGSSTRTTAPVGDLCLKMSCLGVPWAKKVWDSNSKLTAKKYFEFFHVEAVLAYHS